MRTPHILLGAVGAAALISGCDGNNHGNPVPIAFGASPTATASLAPGATPSPTPSPTSTPTAVSAPPGSSIQGFCTLTNSSVTSNEYPPVPGTYTLLIDEGQLTGSSFSPVFGEYEPVTVVSPSPGPTLSPTPVPTPTSSASPTYVYDVYTGGYSVPGYVQPPPPSASPGATALTVNATTGCFLLVQEVQPSPEPQPSESPFNTYAIGLPFDVNAENDGGVSVIAPGYPGTIPTFGLTTFSPSSGGSGSFTLDNGVVGTFQVGAQQVFTEAKLRRAEKFFHNRFRKN